MLLEVGDVAVAAGGEVVDCHDRRATRDEALGEVAPDEARSSGDQDAQRLGKGRLAAVHERIMSSVRAPVSVPVAVPDPVPSVAMRHSR